MHPTQEQKRGIFQRELDDLPDDGTLTLMPREYPGPVVLKRPLVIDGQGSTVWALNGPVISCEADGITLRNLRIEITGATETGRAEDHCALKVSPGCGVALENVEVRGSVIGLWQEDGDWHYPHSLQIGSVPFSSELDLILRVWVPVPCEISSKISGLLVQPQKLEPGANEITLHIERIAKDTLLNGTLSISTPNFKRSIAVGGYISSSRSKKPRSKKTVQVVWQPDDWERLVALPRPPLPVPPPPVPPPPIPPRPISPPIPIPGPAPIQPPVQPPPIQPPPVQPPPVQPPPIQPPPIQPILPPPVLPLVPPADSVPWYRRPLVIVLGAIFVLVVIFGAYLLIPKIKIFSTTNIDPDKLKALPRLEQKSGARAVAFSRYGKSLASGSDGDDGVVVLWDMETQQSKSLPPKRTEITSLAFSPDEKMLAGGTATGSVIVWDVEKKEELLLNLRHSATVNSVAFSPDSQSIVSGGDDQLILWNVQTGKRTQLGDVRNTKAVAFSPDGTTVASGDEEGNVKLWDSKSGVVREQLSPKHEGAVMSLAFSNDGKILATGSKDTKLILWDTLSGRRNLPSPFRHNDPVSSVIFSPDDKLIISRSGSTVSLWDVQSGQMKKSLAAGEATKTSPNGVAVSSDGKIASGSSDGFLRLWGP